MLGGINKRQSNIGPINGERFLKIQNDYVLAFFNKYLKGELSDLLNDSTRKYEEVIFIAMFTGKRMHINRWEALVLFISYKV